MKQWFVKDLSKITGVSTQTLHHYDRIDLLKPSHRLANGYRVYSESDLLKLQQIIALKYFGFELKKIKLLLGNNVDAIAQFQRQVNVLEHKAKNYIECAKTLRTIIDAVDNAQSIPWKNIIETIEVYRMSEQLEHEWVREIFSPDELKQYMEFEKQLKRNSTPEKKLAFENNWQNLLSELKNNLHHDPNSTIGIRLGEKYMNWINSVYGKKYAHLRTKKWEQGFGEGKGLDDIGFTPELLSWVEQATNAYWHHRIYAILQLVETESSSKVLKLWNAMLDDLYGEEIERKNAIYHKVLDDDNVSDQAKQWLRKNHQC